MDGTYYASLSRQTLSEKLSGSRFTWPQLIAGDTVAATLRFSKRSEGAEILKNITVRDLYATVSRIDQRPKSGTFKIKVGPVANESVQGTNLTAALSWDSTAADWQTALNALSIVGVDQTYGPAVVTLDNGTFIVEFEGTFGATKLTLAENELAPTAILHTQSWERDLVWLNTARLMEAPVAMTSTFDLEAGPRPSIERHRLGAEVDGDKTNEIQILVMPADFEGAAEFERDGIRSKPFNKSTTPETYQEILAPLADQGGIFAVSDVLPGEAWIEFTGSMEATAQDLLETFVVRAPGSDVAFKLSLAHGNVYELLREKTEVDVFFQIRVIYEDENDSEELHTWSYLQKVKLVRGAHWEGLDVDEAVDFLKKPADRYSIVTDDQIITGTQHYERAFPATEELGGTLITHTHNLDEKLGHVVVSENASPGRRLIEGTDYLITSTGADQFELQLLAGGYFEAPITENNGGTWEFVRTGAANLTAENALVVAFSTIGPRSAFIDHEHVEEDIPTIPPKFVDIFARLAVIESQLLTNFYRGNSSDSAVYSRQHPIPAFGAIFPILGRSAVTFVPGTRIGEIDLATLPRFTPPLYGAVHDTTVDELPTTGTGSALAPAVPTSANKGGAYENVTEFPLFLSVGQGYELQPGEFAATDGEAWYPVEQYGSNPGTSYYPAHQVVELFEETVEAEELIAGRQYRLQFSTGLAVLRANAPVYCHLVVEIANLTEDATPGTPGPNLKADDWEADPVLDQRLTLTGTPVEPVFGYQVTRAADGTLTADKYLYGKWISTTAPDSARFAIRARLVRWDTPAKPEQVTGFIAYSGPTFESGPVSEMGDEIGFSIVD